MTALSLQEVCAAIQTARGDALAVVTMSPIAYWTDRREDDYMLFGLMGGAASIGLGIAIGRPDRRVIVVDGDGSLLMQLGVLGAVADAAPSNFKHIVIENSIYAVSGGQPTPGKTDWPGLFLAAGYTEAVACSSQEEIAAALAREVDGPFGIAIRCVSERPDYPDGGFAGIDPAAEAARVRRALAD